MLRTHYSSSGGGASCHQEGHCWFLGILSLIISSCIHDFPSHQSTPPSQVQCSQIRLPLSSSSSPHHQTSNQFHQQQKSTTSLPNNKYTSQLSAANIPSSFFLGSSRNKSSHHPLSTHLKADSRFAQTKNRRPSRSCTDGPNHTFMHQPHKNHVRTVLVCVLLHDFIDVVTGEGVRSFPAGSGCGGGRGVGYSKNRITVQCTRTFCRSLWE